MRKLSLIVISILGLLAFGCDDIFEDDYPTFPYGGEYDGDDYSGGGGGYGGDYDQPDWARDVLGEWEGFMWEDYRSDGRPLGKKTLAMRITDSGYSYSGDYQHVHVNVIVDGHPAGSTSTGVGSGGYISFCSHASGVDFSMNGRFRSGSASGDIDLNWEEKVKNQYTGKTDMHWVQISGEFQMGRVRGSHWAAAWELFDTYGEGIWDLPDDVWQSATLEGITHLEACEQTFVRPPSE